MKGTIKIAVLLILILWGKYPAVFSQNSEKYNADQFYKDGIEHYQVFEKEFDHQETTSNKPNEELMYHSLLKAFSNFFKADSYIDHLSEIYKIRMRNIVLYSNDKLIVAGTYFYESKRYDKAQEAFKQFLEVPLMNVLKDDSLKDSLNTETYLSIKFYTAISAMNDGNHPMAIAYLDDLLKSGFRENEMLQYLIQEYETVGDNDKVDEVLQVGMKKFPSDNYFLYRYINSFILKGNYDQAIHFLNQAIAENPGQTLLYCASGRIYEEIIDLDNAEKSYKKALSIEPENEDALYGVGRLYYNQALELQNNAFASSDKKVIKENNKKAKKRFKEALPYFEKLYSLKPEEKIYLIALQNTYISLKMEKKAEAIGKKREEI